MDKITFTRTELYNLVWKFPLIQIARHYEISSMGIKDACEQLQIPLPNNKHWTRPEFKRKNIPELSSDYIGITEIGILKKKYEIHLRKTSKKTPLLDLVESIKSDKNAPLNVVENLENPVEIIKRTQEYWENRTFENEFTKHQQKILKLNVSEENLIRALYFINAFIKLIEYRGHRFQKSENGNDIVLLKNNIEIKVDLREALKRITHNGLRETSEYVFTGDFILRIAKGSNKKEWRDGKISIENNLALIVAKLELMANDE